MQPDHTDGDLHLSIDSPSGIPLGVAGFLIGAIGSAYPHTKVRHSNPGGPVLEVAIPPTDYIDTDADPADVPDPSVIQDDEHTQAFVSAIAGAELNASIPSWLSAILATLSQQIVDSSDAPNYLQMEVQHGQGKPFAWIVCRPGASSPHDLRDRAEARIATLESHMRAHGLNPEDV